MMAGNGAIGALRSGSWLTRERVRRIAMIAGLGSIALIVWLFATSSGTLDWIGRPLGTDFSNVWTAGRMALEGRAAEAWNWDAHFAVQRAVQSLPDRCREVFELSRVHGLKYAEIARTLGISVKTVEAQMGKALRILRERLAIWTT